MHMVLKIIHFTPLLHNLRISICLLLVDGTRQSPVIGKILKDGKPLTSKDVDINVLDDKVTFTFKKPTHDQSGKYQIKLSNEQGEDTKEISINMQGNYLQFIFYYLAFTDNF